MTFRPMDHCELELEAARSELNIPIFVLANWTFAMNLGPGTGAPSASSSGPSRSPLVGWIESMTALTAVA